MIIWFIKNGQAMPTMVYHRSRVHIEGDFTTGVLRLKSIERFSPSWAIYGSSSQ